MRVLIAGGAGFLASHLADYYLTLGNQVIVVDNLYTGSLANIEHLRNHPDFFFIEQDIQQPINLQKPIDLILNFACPASPVHYQRAAIETYLTNSIGIYQLLELALQKQARFVQASTSECYGDPEIHPQAEEYWGNVNPVGIRSCYDEGKRFAEGLIMEYHRKYSLDVRVIRIFNTYGPRMDAGDGRVVSNFICQVLKEQPITIYGDGSQTRSFCYVDDLVRGIGRVSEIEEISGEIINLGNPSEITILELVEKLEQICGHSIPKVMMKLPQDDPKRRRPNITKAQRLLDWSPEVNLDDGLIKTIEYFRNQLGVKEKVKMK